MVNYIIYAKCSENTTCLECPVRNRALIYGPVKSRRRGNSLGINLYPIAKTCSFDCIYCLRGQTIYKISKPCNEAFQVNINDVVNALSYVLSKLSNVDTVDLSGNGEPTLYPKFPELTKEIRKVCDDYGIKSFGIFTNSSTFLINQVVEGLKHIDHIEAKLDTVVENKFKIINQPHPEIELKNVIQGLYNIRKLGFSKLCIQIMFIKYGNINNFEKSDIEKLCNELIKIDPDEIHIYTAYRKCKLSEVKAVTLSEVIESIELLKSHFSDKVKIYL